MYDQDAEMKRLPPDDSAKTPTKDVPCVGTSVTVSEGLLDGPVEGSGHTSPPKSCLACPMELQASCEKDVCTPSMAPNENHFRSGPQRFTFDGISPISSAGMMEVESRDDDRKGAAVGIVESVALRAKSEPPISPSDVRSEGIAEEWLSPSSHKEANTEEKGQGQANLPTPRDVDADDGIAVKLLTEIEIASMKSPQSQQQALPPPSNVEISVNESIKREGAADPSGWSHYFCAMDVLEFDFQQLLRNPTDAGLGDFDVVMESRQCVDLHMEWVQEEFQELLSQTKPRGQTSTETTVESPLSPTRDLQEDIAGSNSSLDPFEDFERNHHDLFLTESRIIAKDKLAPVPENEEVGMAGSLVYEPSVMTDERTMSPRKGSTALLSSPRKTSFDLMTFSPVEENPTNREEEVAEASPPPTHPQVRDTEKKDDVGDEPYSNETGSNWLEDFRITPPDCKVDSYTVSPPTSTSFEAAVVTNTTEANEANQPESPAPNHDDPGGEVAAGTTTHYFPAQLSPTHLRETDVDSVDMNEPITQKQHSAASTNEPIQTDKAPTESDSVDTVDMRCPTAIDEATLVESWQTADPPVGDQVISPSEPTETTAAENTQDETDTASSASVDPVISVCEPTESAATEIPLDDGDALSSIEDEATESTNTESTQDDADGPSSAIDDRVISPCEPTEFTVSESTQRDKDVPSSAIEDALTSPCEHKECAAAERAHDDADAPLSAIDDEAVSPCEPTETTAKESHLSDERKEASPPSEAEPPMMSPSASAQPTVWTQVATYAEPEETAEGTSESETGILCATNCFDFQPEEDWTSPTTEEGVSTQTDQAAVVEESSPEVALSTLEVIETPTSPREQDVSDAGIALSGDPHAVTSGAKIEAISELQWCDNASNAVSETDVECRDRRRLDDILCADTPPLKASPELPSTSCVGDDPNFSPEEPTEMTEVSLSDADSSGEKGDASNLREAVWATPVPPEVLRALELDVAPSDELESRCTAAAAKIVRCLTGVGSVAFPSGEASTSTTTKTKPFSPSYLFCDGFESLIEFCATPVSQARTGFGSLWHA